MLYRLLYMFQGDLSWLNVFRYITFRSVLSTLTALFISFVFGRFVINLLRQLKAGQYVRDEGPARHKAKEGTPTMGGCLIIPAILVSSLLWADPANLYTWVVAGVALLFGAIGFADDYLKIKRKNNLGLTAKSKFLMQLLVAALASVVLYSYPGFDSRLYLPFFKGLAPDLGWGYVLMAVFVIVGTSNAVNLTDGLDGLAISPIIVAFGTYLIFSYLAGHVKIASYLQIPYVAGSGELSVLCGAAVGAGLGFLWYNTYPAEVFMGDVGSLSLGAILGTVALITKQEIMLILVGGLFVFEALSVIFQVGYFKITGGHRIFRMAPIHHHFELKGWPEPKVIVRFWIIAIILALMAFSTLKLR
ncbi:MAG: phospho-N-acetylmuramoyl-pentapeptide-transferase [Deltaproteobacteria bacterium CG23_combo_of_CG06-09_8_20_14_all_51_20]|nr:phospho-N-acetylmuramoyl-pentapeptide-transferase [bacterium]OIP43710.1 MAG: phospho-N-acetylmuramoyl-pentapeptide-transferase [Desulfobacteraceae bacterium CG2_30_51_40]PIP48151.1 MAG: phospho-N-acetylmuramoyl-pentapeptide-transferase [Deltaproteobacteria bacterium CG23_combo_of_CG06-09_8_20_14_all_51_20]PJB35052.1 MAG: phospho-N-acetylmuramoyl-pentapeptide-transferase [Deltaproteobacteria bacterium CG_4_9_14_3_um_filter_51_14]